MYSVRGRTAATAATADHAICALWNPHATQRIKVVTFTIVAQGTPGAGLAWRFRRTSARGTAGSTVTPGITNDHRNAVAPVSGVLLDLASFGGSQPTLTGNDLGIDWVLAAVQASGIVFPFPGGIEIPPAAGLALIQVAATAMPICDVTFDWLEDY